MADKIKNVFELLEDDSAPRELTSDDSPVTPPVPETYEAPATSTSSNAASDANQGGSDAGAWTDVSRSRRLVPQYSLSKELMGAKASAGAPSSTTPHGSTPHHGTHHGQHQEKKKIIRFTRDELLNLRRPSKPIPELEELVDVIFLGQQEPECNKKYDHEEYHRLWSVQSDRGPRTGVPGAGGSGRGRGRGRPTEGAGGALEDQGSAPSWGRETAEWDDGAKTSDGLDLADFSAASLKFSSEMGSAVEAGQKVDLYGTNDALDGLYQEQQKGRNPQKIDDDNDIPSWAQDSLQADDARGNVFGLAPSRPSAAPVSRTNDEGRSILNALLSSNVSNAVSFESTLKSEPADVGLAINMLSFKEDPVLVQNDHHQLLGGLGVSSLHQSSTSQAPSMLLPPALQTFHQIPLPEYTLDDSVWLYLDPRGRIQGLFSTTSMHQWMLDGYFAPTLPIKLEHWSSFHPLYTVFSDPPSAFQSIPREPGTAPIGSMMQPMNSAPSYASVSAAPAKPLQGAIIQPGLVASVAPIAPVAPVASVPPVTVASVESDKVAPQLAATAAEPTTSGGAPQPKHQEKKSEKAHKEKDTARAVPVAVSEENKSSQFATATAPQASVPAPTPKKESKAPWTKAAAVPAAVDTAKSLAAIQAEELERAKKREEEAAAQTKVKSTQLKSVLGLPTSPANKGAVWGSSAAPLPSSGSLKDIQEQEEKRRLEEEAAKKQSAAAALAQAVAAAPKWAGAASTVSQAKSASQSLAEIMEQEKAQYQAQNSTAATSSAPAASSWAAKAAKSATSTGSYNALAAVAAPKAAPVKIAAPAAAAPAPAKRPGEEVESFWNFSDQKPTDVPAAPVASKAAKPTTPKASSDGMPSAIADWCKEQLRKMNQSDDLSLIQVCYSMQSAVDIREYLADYLGSTPQVSLFATEFIKRKNSPSGQPTIAATVNPNMPQTGGAVGVAAGKSKKKATAKGK